MGGVTQALCFSNTAQKIFVDHFGRARPFWSGSTKMVGLDQNGRQREGSVRVYTVHFVNAILAGIL